MSMLLAIVALCGMQEPTKGGQEKASFEKVTFPFEGEVTATNLYVRMAPKSDPTAAPVAVLKQGTKVTVVAESGDFFQIVSPPGCTAWIYAKNVKKEGAEGIVTGVDIPVRSDSRTNADKLAILNEGDKVQIIAEHMGWYKIQSPATVKYYVGRKYVKFLGEAKGIATTEEKKEEKKTGEPAADTLAMQKIQAAEKLIAEMNGKIETGDLDGIDFGGIVDLYDQAASLAKSETLKSEAEGGAKRYRHLQSVWATFKAQKMAIEEKIQKLREEQANAKKKVEKVWAYTGYVDTTSFSMPDRPGTHKLVMSGKVIVFLKFKEGDTEMLKRLNNSYKKYVGVTGTIIKDPKGWEGMSVVIVEDIQVIDKK